MAFTYPAMVAWDPNGKQTVKNVSFQVYATSDTAFTTPLAITDPFGVALPGNILNSGSQGVFPQFQQATNATVVIADASHLYAWTVIAIQPPTQDSAVAGFINDKTSTTAAAVRSQAAGIWQPNTSYTAGQAVVNAYGTLVKASTTHTSGATYAPANWAPSNGILNVKNFGAKGDGLTDDTAAIQATVNQAGTYGHIYFPAGTYVISAPISISAESVTIRGAGYRTSRLYLSNNSNSSMLVTADDGVQRYGLLISDLSFAGNASNQTVAKPAIDIRGMNESRIEGVYILEPSGDAIHVGQTTAGMYSTVPMISRAIIRGHTTASKGNGINLDAGSSDAQIIGCDIGFFTNGAGIALSGHNGYELIGNMSWQNKNGFMVYASHRGRITACLSDYAKQHGFVIQNSNDTQLVGCQARESSITTANTYDGFFVQGVDAAHACYDTILTGCRGMGSQQRYGANLDQYINQAQVSGSDWQGNTSGGIRYGTTSVVGVTRWDATPLVTDGTGNTLFGFDTSGRAMYSQFTSTATAGASGAVPAQVQGYLTINIGGGLYKVPYFNA